MSRRGHYPDRRRRFRTACASLMLFIDPGMSISVNANSISSRVSSRTMASSAFEAFESGLLDHIEVIDMEQRIVLDDKDYQP